MKVLVTGGAGFIGRWVAKKLLDKKIDVWILDNLSNGSRNNIKEFNDHPNFKKLVVGDVRDKKLLEDLFKNKFEVCIHLAAGIDVQKSIDDSRDTFDVNINGTLNILEESLKNNVKPIVIGTCMVYERSYGEPMDENHPVKPRSPYAGSKSAADLISMSYHYAYGLPVTVLRPFNTYGPYQKTTAEGGVISIFIKGNLEGKILNIFGDGKQTRDFLYVEDCADFIVRVALSKKTEGEIINCGSGKDTNINDLALMITKNKGKIKHVKHIHPQAEIQKLISDNSKAKKILGWEPKTSLEEGIKKTEEWIKQYGY